MACPLLAVAIPYQSKHRDSTPQDCTVKDWKYLSEGGEHVIFEYRPTLPVSRTLCCGSSKNIKTKTEHEKWEGLILRIRKASIKDSLQNQFQCKEPTKNVNLSICFAQVRLRKYFDTPETIYIDSSFVNELRKEALQSGQIPPSRESDWKIPSRSKHSIIHSNSNDVNVASNYGRKPSKTLPITTKMSKIRATVYPNYFRLPTASSTPPLSIEIKPKAGYLAYSPLVHPLHRAKYRHSRFSILQHLHHTKIISKGWCNQSTPIIKSNYSPLDLYSKDLTRIRTALVNLFDSPQNNLRVVYRDTMLYGWDHVAEANCATLDVSNKRHIEALGEIFRIDGVEVGESRSRFAEELQGVAARILEKEALLGVLSELQRSLDSLDADGAVLVYRRLVEIFGGSEDRADAFLDSYMVLATDAGSGCNKFQNEDSTLKEWNTFIQEIQEAGITEEGVNKDDDYDQNYQRATALVKKFSILTCGYLLQQWLASMALCDISFFLTICRVDDGEKPRQRNGALNNMDVITGANGCAWNYCIKIIDCDPKPISKLRGREQKERDMRHFKSDINL